MEVSPLTRLPPPFDISSSLPYDEFHLLKEGITKRLILPICKSTSRDCMVLRAKMSAAFKKVKVFSETPRKMGLVANIADFKGKCNRYNQKQVYEISTLCNRSGMGHVNVHRPSIPGNKGSHSL